ncbi:MAG TPA: laccase domain-containing protein [Erysipelotrichaceae bacterium]|nr:laccase domain-containing protein [Erysipelotrichaceae bacterium]
MDYKFVSFPLSKKCNTLTTTVHLGNLAYQVDDGKNVKEHRLTLADSLDIPLDRFVFVHQTHSDKVLKVELNDLGKGVDSFISGMEGDALYTYLKNVPLCIFHADCVPVFFIDESADLAGIIHAGYEGTLKHVVFKSIKRILEEENIDYKNLKFYIGPYRRKPSFELETKYQQEVIAAGFGEALKDHHFDNGLAVKMDLFRLGIKEKQIEDCELDTFFDERFYSAHRYRLDQTKTPVGRLVSLIYLK